MALLKSFLKTLHSACFPLRPKALCSLSLATSEACVKFPGQGMNLCHSSDNAGSLTHWASGELPCVHFSTSIFLPPWTVFIKFNYSLSRSGTQKALWKLMTRLHGRVGDSSRSLCASRGGGGWESHKHVVHWSILGTVIIGDLGLQKHLSRKNVWLLIMTPLFLI